MKTTLDLPDDLMRTVKIRAIREHRKLKDMVAELLRRGLARDEEQDFTVTRRQVHLPLIRCAHAAPSTEEMTPARVAQILLDEEADMTAAA